MSVVDDPAYLERLDSLESKISSNPHDLFFMDSCVVYDYLFSTTDYCDVNSIDSVADGRISSGVSRLKGLLDNNPNAVIIPGVTNEITPFLKCLLHHTTPLTTRRVSSLLNSFKDYSESTHLFLQEFSRVNSVALMLRTMDKKNSSKNWKPMSKVDSLLLASAFWCAYNHPGHHVDASVVTKDYDLFNGYKTFMSNSEEFSVRFPNDFPDIIYPERGNVSVLYTWNSGVYRDLTEVVGKQ